MNKKKWKQRCSAILGLSVLGFSGAVEVVAPFVNPVVVYATEENGGGANSNSLTFTAKSKTETDTTTKTTHKPMDLLLVMDLSGSLSDKMRQDLGYSGGSVRYEQFLSMKHLIENVLTDEDRVSFAVYGGNTDSSYATGDGPNGRISKLKTKKEALKMFDNLLAAKGSVLYTEIVGDRLVASFFHTDELATDKKDEPFEETFDRLTEGGSADHVRSILQYTDGWSSGETIDTSFANWAKANAKTFMSVLYLDKYSGDNSSKQKMIDIGHPNVLDIYGDKKTQKDIEDAFINTATETIVTERTVKQKGTVSISPEADLTLTSAELVSPNGQKTPLTITNNTVSWSGDLDNGSYTVNYTFTGTPSVERSIRSSVTVDGKKVDEKINTLRPEKIAFETKYEEDPSLAAGQEKEKQAGSEGSQLVSLKDGKVISTTITKPKVDRIVLRGTKGSDVEVKTEDIPFNTTYTEDPELEIGQTKVVTEGAVGQKEITKTYVTQSGKRVGDPAVTEKILKKAVDKVIAKGTKGQDVDVAESDIDFKTVYTEDPELEFGQEKIVTEGVLGVKRTTKTYVTQKGVRTKDEPSIKEEVLKEAVDKVVARGSKSAVTTKELDYKTTYVEDKESEAGKKTVVTKGSKGHETTTITYSFNSETGEVTANEPKVEKTESVDEVISVGTKPVVTTKDLDYKTKYVEDKESEAGKKTVVTKGSKGHETTTITYSFNSETGEVTANEPKVEKTESVDEVISVGTKPKVEIMETEFKTEKRENKDLKKGEEKIIQVGVKGRETITTTYYLNPDTGEVKENKPSLEKVDPVNEIIEVGTQAEKVLPNTGTSLSNFLTLTGMIGIVLGISVIIYRKLNKK